jgi:two-component system, NtrC family, nitrogen regulation sensor histidine kinase NtrY
MLSRGIYINITIRILSIVICSILAGFLFSGSIHPGYPILLVLIVILLTINLISYLNTTNRKIQFFFDAVRNEDSSLLFPADSGSKSLKGLYTSMNNVNQQIQQLRIENRQQEQYFQSILEHLATGIMTFDRKGFILHANSAVKMLLSVEILTHIQQIERIDRKLYMVLKTIRQSERKLVSLSTERGEIQLSVKASAFIIHNEELTILSIQDIRNELDEKELDSWMKLIRVLMHEIMNSITPITSLSETLLNTYLKDDKPVTPSEVNEKTISTTIQGLAVIRKQGKGLMSFVDSYRKLTRIPEPDRKMIQVADLITRIQILYNSLDGSDRIKLQVAMEYPDNVLFADEDQVSLVLINLLKNAIEANRENENAMITISVNRNPDNSVEICVVDNGPGIPVSQIEEIFVPFFTTREEGSGIGLSISRQIMRLHGGNLKVRSVPGKETIFCMSFRNE